MHINFSEQSASQRYHLMTQTIIPRPIAWALTESALAPREHSHFNLAPFSYFTAVSSEPALLMLSVGKKPNGDDKDTLRNILNNKRMVIHIASEQQAPLVTKTAASLAHEVSEFSMLSENNMPLDTVAFDGFSLPRLKDCDIAYGCELYDIKEIGDTPQTLIFVEIKQLYVNAEKVTMQNNDRIKINAAAIKPLARLGANEYAGISDPFSHLRPE